MKNIEMVKEMIDEAILLLRDDIINDSVMGQWRDSLITARSNLKKAYESLEGIK